MRADVVRFAGEFDPPALTVSPLVDRGMGTLQGAMKRDFGVRQAFYGALLPELTDSEQLPFRDALEGSPPSLDWLLDRFTDATGGVSPGCPTVKGCTPEARAAMEDTPDGPDTAVAQLDRFYAATKMRRRPFPPHAAGASRPTEGIWMGSTHKFLAQVLLSEETPLLRVLLHEFGHCGLRLVGFNNTVETVVDLETRRHRLVSNWPLATRGLIYETADGTKGRILEEAVAEGLGALASRRLRIVQEPPDDRAEWQLPEMVAPYMNAHIPGGGLPCITAAPAAVALELIAQELDIPADRYFRMFVDYANAGVYNADARQEVAETVYRGTRGKLTLAQVEELPYPAHTEANLALLWAVEDALDVPDHARYSRLFSKVGN